MVEEGKPIEEETKKSYLDEVRKEKEELIKLRDELRELRANEILSGTTDAGKKEPEKPIEETPQDYAERALKGQVGE